MKRSAPNIADHLADRFTTHSVDLLRFDASERQRIRRLLRQVERDIVAQLEREDPSAIRRPTFRDRRLIALAEQVQAIIRSGYREIATSHGRALRDLAEIEEALTRTAINATVGADVMTVGVSEASLRQIARGTLIGDLDKRAVTRDWWAGQSDRLARDFSRVVRVGLYQGESIGDLVRRVRGTTRIVGGARVVEGGIMRASYRDASSLVRTAVSAVSNAARAEVMRANGDVVKGEQVVVTWDNRLSPTCLALGSANAAWDFDGNPLPQSGWRHPKPPGPPFHWGCRSTLIPVLRSMAEILKEAGARKAGAVAKLPAGTRATMDGQVAASLSLESWLRSKPDAFVDGLVGRTRAHLWRAGHLPLSSLVDQSARPLNLEQLRQRVRGVTARAIAEAAA